MNFIADLFVGLVLLEHLGFLYLEMFLWSKPAGQKMFKMSATFATESAPLAKNQGLYNGFLAAGLLWGLLNDNPFTAFDIKLFFLSCISIAGIFGSFTVNRRIFYLQAVPALISILLIFFAK